MKSKRIYILFIIIFCFCQCNIHSYKLIKGENAEEIYKKKGLAMSDYFRPEILELTEKVYGIFEIHKPNCFLTMNDKGEYCIFTFQTAGNYKVETILKDFPPYGGSNIQTDPWNNIVWQNEGRYVRVLEIDEKKRHGFSSVGDVNTVISQIFFFNAGTGQIYIRLSFSTKIFESKTSYVIYDLDRRKIIYRSSRIRGRMYPFTNGKLLFDAYEDKKWFIIDPYLKNKDENDLTKALSQINIFLGNSGRKINIEKRFIIGTAKDPAGKRQYFTIRWDENYEDVKIEPIIAQKPQNGIFDSGPIISADGNWMKTTAYIRKSPVDASRLLLYHLNSVYPQGLSMPIMGGYTHAEAPGAFVMHDEWGPVYVEQDHKFRDKLFIYKLNDGLKFLAEETASGFGK